MQRLALWQKQEYTGMKPGLGRMCRFLAATGDPQERFAVAHIAGTNGKGATARMLSLILENAGYRTGLYISPHLVRINERIQINSRTISDRELDRLVKKYSKIAEKSSLTFFEFMTGLAFHYFAQEGVDIAVLETGLGGKYDATNVVKKPKISIITDIDFDHRQFLGNRLAAIAGEKAGIIKQGCPVISGVERPAAARVVKREALGKDSPFYEINRDFTYSSHKTVWKKGYQQVSYNGLDKQWQIHLPLLGDHQAKNCSLVLAASEVLERQGFALPSKTLQTALKAVRWPGRFDVRRVRHGKKQNTYILDGAHNPGAIKRFVRTWDESPFSKRKMTLVFGVLGDKDYRTIVKELAPRTGKVILTPVSSPRALSVKDMMSVWRKYLPANAIACADSFKDALKKTGNEAIVAVTGSLYLVSEALKELD
jgi:dihydrofolate synthase/folylpolyglutamate synthase